MSLGGEDRKELSSLNVFPFELKIAYYTSNLSVHFILFMLIALQWILIKAVCTQANLPAIIVISGFITAVANGSILPWALSKEGPILVF